MVVYYKYSSGGSKKVGKDNGRVKAKVLAAYSLLPFAISLSISSLNGVFNAKHSIGGIVFTVNERNCH